MCCRPRPSGPGRRGLRRATEGRRDVRGDGSHGEGGDPRRSTVHRRVGRSGARARDSIDHCRSDHGRTRTQRGAILAAADLQAGQLEQAAVVGSQLVTEAWNLHSRHVYDEISFLAVHPAIVPPSQNPASSGCATTTRMRSTRLSRCSVTALSSPSGPRSVRDADRCTPSEPPEPSWVARNRLRARRRPSGTSKLRPSGRCRCSTTRTTAELDVGVRRTGVPRDRVTRPHGSPRAERSAAREGTHGRPARVPARTTGIRA